MNGMSNMAPCKPVEPLNDLAAQLVDILESSQSKIEVMDDRLYGNPQAKCLNEKAPSTCNLQDRLLKAVRLAIENDKNLDMLVQRI